MQMTIESGRKYDIVSPDELTVNLAHHHSRLVDDLIRKQYEGLKLINRRYIATQSSPYSLPTLEGYIFSLLFLSLSAIGGNPTTNVYISDDPNTLNAADIVGTSAANISQFTYSTGQFIVRAGQTLMVAPTNAATSIGGIITGVLLPSEMVGKLYL